MEEVQWNELTRSISPWEFFFGVAGSNPISVGGKPQTHLSPSLFKFQFWHYLSGVFLSWPQKISPWQDIFTFIYSLLLTFRIIQMFLGGDVRIHVYFWHGGSLVGRSASKFKWIYNISNFEALDKNAWFLEPSGKINMLDLSHSTLWWENDGNMWEDASLRSSICWQFGFPTVPP